MLALNENNHVMATEDDTTLLIALDYVLNIAETGPGHGWVFWDHVVHRGALTYLLTHEIVTSEGSNPQPVSAGATRYYLTPRGWAWIKARVDAAAD